MASKDPESEYSQFEQLLDPSEGNGIGGFGDHELLERMGCGTAGLVYRGKRSVKPERQVALKVLQQSELRDKKSRERFEREASKVAMEFDDHIMPVLDIGEVAGVPYFTMPFWPGKTLEAKLQEGELPIPDVIRIGIEIAQGLSAAHGRLGIMHRDLKPSNIWITAATSGVKILDFGLALPLTPHDPRLSTQGLVIGTPAYCSPEQARFQVDYDHRSDLFSLGTVLYQLATGELPFDGDMGSILRDIANKAVPPASDRNPRVSQAFSEVIAKLMQKKPEERYENASEVSEALRAVSSPASGSPEHEGLANEDPDATALAAHVLKVEPHRMRIPLGNVVALTTTSIISNQLRRTVDKLLFDLATLEDEIAELQPYDLRDIKARAKTMVKQYSNCVERARITGLLEADLSAMDDAVREFLATIIAADYASPTGNTVAMLSQLIGATRIVLKERGLNLEQTLRASDAQLHQLCTA